MADLRGEYVWIVTHDQHAPEVYADLEDALDDIDWEEADESHKFQSEDSYFIDDWATAKRVKIQ